MPPNLVIDLLHEILWGLAVVGRVSSARGTVRSDCRARDVGPRFGTFVLDPLSIAPAQLPLPLLLHRKNGLVQDVIESVNVRLAPAVGERRELVAHFVSGLFARRLRAGGKFEGGTYKQEAAVGPHFFNVWLPIERVYEKRIVLVKGRAREAHPERLRSTFLVSAPFGVFAPADTLL